MTMYHETDYHRHQATRRGSSCRGFLLIEMLVYIAVLVVITLAVISTVLSLRGVFEKARANHLLMEAAENSLERMVFEIDAATSVDAAGSVFDVSPGTLALIGDAGTRSFYLDGGQLRVTENGADAGPLTPPAVSVGELVFTHYQNAHTEGVRVSLRLEVTEPVTLTKTFHVMTLLRNSYE